MTRLAKAPAHTNAPTDAHRVVVASWSGGVDSTGVLAHLLWRGYDVRSVTLLIYGAGFGRREQAARHALRPALEALAARSGARWTHETHEADFLWAFGDGVEIPRRNKRILDYLCVLAERHGTRNVAMGEYTGADTWLVQDHVAGADADHRALASYLYAEYGLAWRLFSLQDFGESRYKADRLRIGYDALGPAIALTANCLVDDPAADAGQHCGACYKCVERAAAFDAVPLYDPTPYATPPRDAPSYADYRRQMRGETLTRAFASFETSGVMPLPADDDAAARALSSASPSARGHG